MTHDVVTVDTSSSLQACAGRMRVHGLRALPVVDGARLLGMVTESDVSDDRRGVTIRQRQSKRAANRHDLGALTAEDVITSRVVTTTADASIAAAAREMCRHGVHTLPVVDVDGLLVGIVSRSDLLRVFLRSDASIRSEVAADLARDALVVWRGWVVPHVRDGVVTLSGEVEQGTLVDVLLRLVSAVPGVVGVKNDLAIFGSRPGAVDAGRPRSLARP